MISKYCCQYTCDERAKAVADPGDGEDVGCTCLWAGPGCHDHEALIGYLSEALGDREADTI